MTNLKIFKYVKPLKHEYSKDYEITNKEHFESLFFFKESFEYLKIQRCYILEDENIIKGPFVLISNFKQVFGFEKDLNPILKLKLMKNGFDLNEPTDFEISKYVKSKI